VPEGLPHAASRNGNIIPTRAKANSFWSFRTGARHVHRLPRLGQCMILGAGWYKTTRASYSRRGRYLGESISQPFSCPAMDGPGYAGCVAKILQSATPIPGANNQGPGPSQKSAAFRKSFAISSATNPEPVSPAAQEPISGPALRIKAARR
jgi:hypothetical protein